MIYAYVGMPGSGKSYNVVANQILPALRAGRKVVTNIPLHMDRLRAVVSTGTVVEFPVQAVLENPDSIKDYVTAGCVFVLDEVWRLFPSGEKVNKVPEAFKSLLAEHRHMVDAKNNSTQIVLVVQDLANIGAFARRLVEQTFIHTKLTHVGASSRFRVDIFHGAIGGVSGPQSQRIREIFGQYKKEIWDLYKSHTMTEAKEEGANEKAVDTRGNIFKRPAFIFGIPLLVVAVWYGYHSLHKLGVERGLIAGGVPVAAPVVASVGNGVASKPLFAAPVTGLRALERVNPPPPITWRVMGYLEMAAGSKGTSMAALRSSTGHWVNVPFEDCRHVDGFVECMVSGGYWSELGQQESAAVNRPIHPTVNGPP